MVEKVSLGILAGGESRRMGRQKTELPIRGNPAVSFLDHAIAEGREFPEILLSARADKFKDWQRKYPACRIIVDQLENIGPVEGLYQLIKHSAFEKILVIAADMPKVNRDFMKFLAEYRGWENDYDCLVSSSGGKRQQLCAVYTKKCLSALEEIRLTDKHAVYSLFTMVRVYDLALDRLGLTDDLLQDIDTPDAYQSYLHSKS